MGDQGTAVGDSAAPLDEAIGLSKGENNGEWSILRWEPRPLAMGATEPTPYLHGGAIATCVDTAAWEAVARTGDAAWVVADMRIDFLRLASPVPHLVRSVVRRAGRKQATVDVEIVESEAPERVIALGRVLMARVG